MTRKEKILRLQLSQVAGIGPATFVKVLEKFGTVSSFLECDSRVKSKIMRNCRLSGSLVGYDFDTSDFLVLGEQNYPHLLSQMNDPPPVIFKSGSISDLNNCNFLSIVGTRKPSDYGNEMARQITTRAVEKGFVVVSGLALGIDSVAHRAALEAGGETVAILGTGIRNVYPRTNIPLASKVKNKGLLLSEFHNPPDTQKHLFPRRNRIIAGISTATIVVEAPEKSGALITADFAFNYNRFVYAVPSNASSFRGRGGNKLIQSNKAKLFTSIEDILVDLSPTLTGDSRQLDENHEDPLVTVLCSGASNFDEILKSVNMTAAKLRQSLTDLELRGVIAKDVLGNYTVLTTKS
ncbi:MAG: DNA-processing protein DprA [Candidatus Dojkabacteria bacterium]